MALKKSQLYSSLWQSCDELCGGSLEEPQLMASGRTKNTRNQWRWCMNRLDPSGELRAGFGEA